nr:hypothetical protein [Tanacetum cinerariifolium]
AAITRGRLAFPAPEAQGPEQTWELVVDLGANPDEATLSFSCPGVAIAPRETTYLAAHVQAVYALLGHSPATPVGYAFFLAEEEVAQLRQFRTTTQQVPEGGPQLLHQIFEETARTYPNQHLPLGAGRAVAISAHAPRPGGTGIFSSLRRLARRAVAGLGRRRHPRARARRNHEGARRTPGFLGRKPSHHILHGAHAAFAA